MFREEPEAKLHRLTYADEATDERGRDWARGLDDCRAPIPGSGDALAHVLQGVS